MQGQAETATGRIAAATAFAALVVLLPGCAREQTAPTAPTAPTALTRTATTASPPLAAEQAEFWAALESLCGKAFEGEVIEDSSDDPRFARSPLIMHVMRCEDGRLLVPLHIADDHSRTWIFTTTPTGLRLKHDHRHEDGSEDEITQYGGDTRDAGAPTRQRFHADEHTASLIPAAATNIWTVEIIPGRTFAYMLERVGTDRRFRVEFDLTREVAPPRAPWGW